MLPVADVLADDVVEEDRVLSHDTDRLAHRDLTNRANVLPTRRLECRINERGVG